MIDTGDNTANWQAKGTWKQGQKAGMQGGGWFADSTKRGHTSVLVAQVLIDLTSAQSPELRFWQTDGFVIR